MRQTLFFSATWCAACQTIKPIVEQVSKSGNQIKTIDTDYDVSLVEKYHIKSVPTIIILENGQEIKRHSGGGLNASQLNNLING